ncbi:hypothetical protein C8Q75DRAFT_809268 [Abortiporus biennis]|nr:hypothetical protein C8Q75DRAFT_809268 [Abortiporus biennis]
MANVATMGPPPSPKEPRRSGRRSAPSTSKSPAGSPTSDGAPRSKELTHRPPNSSASHTSKKKTKHEDVDDIIEDLGKVNGHNGTTNGRNKRKGKEKDKNPATHDIHDEEEAGKVESVAGDGSADPQEEEEQGITRCICEGTMEEDADAGEYMAMCEICHTWQHGPCMGYNSIEEIPNSYFCERCKPEMYPELLKKYAKRARQASATSHHTVTAVANARSSRSHSPNQSKSTKRRNTMNSRDARYEEEYLAALQVSAAEAAAHEAEVNGGEKEIESVITQAEPEDPDPPAPVNKKKRKRLEDDAISAKKARSESVLSDHTTTNQTIREPTPIAATKPPPPAVPPSKASARSKRQGGRKAHAHVQDDGDEVVITSTRRQGNNRVKANANNEHITRRNHANAMNGATSHNPASGRAYHNTHAYAVSQQPLFTSWNLPDYLSHLESMLPTDTPRPLEVRGYSTTSNGHQEVVDSTTERGVKVKWPSKRMSMGDMNKRVRALVEWVGREQASTAERTRRREAVEKALHEAQSSNGVDSDNAGVDSLMIMDGSLTESPLQDKRPSLSGRVSSFALDKAGSESESSTMKMMEELMEELINFQERFGPGSKMRDRRTVSS